MSKTKVDSASVLAFERNLDISDAVFTQTTAQNTKEILPVLVVEKSIRGTISNRLKNAITSDPVKLDAEIQKANLQKVDVANLDSDKDTLIVNWTCKVIPFTGKPSVCNNLDYQEQLMAKIQSYVQEHGLAELAKRYAVNIVNGRWLWRNRMSTNKIEVQVRNLSDDKAATINISDAKAYSLNDFSQQDGQIKQLAQWIETGLSGDKVVILSVQAKLVMGLGQEVYPSQELILDTGKTKSKVLYTKNGYAAMHSQKISNAIRTIDTWYDENAAFPIAVEPYGAVTTMGHAFRQPKQKLDFYTLFDNWVLKGEKPSPEQQHYVIAVLIRGGVFGASGKE